MASNWKYVTKEEQQRRIEFSKRERRLIEAFVDVLKTQRPSLEFEVKYSESDKASPFDALLYVKDPLDEENPGNIVLSIIIEAKVRQQEWPTYFLEDFKYKRLKDLQKGHPEFKIWYVNFVPQKALVFMVDYLNLGNIKEIPMNAQTFKSRTKKMTKKVYELKPKDATVVNFNKIIL